jgi:hypothetical protein
VTSNVLFALKLEAGLQAKDRRDGIDLAISPALIVIEAH